MNDHELRFYIEELDKGLTRQSKLLYEVKQAIGWVGGVVSIQLLIIILVLVVN